ncbi:MAG: hypothetical protein R3C40_02185 [Parvularculaceae bacterium]
MISVIDIYSLTLLAISLTIFIVRYFREEPPVAPYLIIACTCAIGNFLGDAGGRMGAIVLLTAASFLFLGCLLHPGAHRRRDRREESASH